MFSMLMADFREKTEKRAKVVSKFLSETRGGIDNTGTLVKANIDSAVFYENLESLARKWFGDAPIGDCDGTRLVNKVLRKEITNPIFIAIVADKKDFFIQCHENLEFTGSYSPIFWLELACICGAANIVGYLLTEIDHSIWTKSSKIIPYLLSSGNPKLTMKVAETAKNFSVTDPGLIDLYSFGDTDTAKMIKDLFKTPLPIVQQSM